MEPKKNANLSITKERPVFTLLGFVFSFTIAFVSFSFTNFESRRLIYEPVVISDPTISIPPVVIENEPEKTENENPKKADSELFEIKDDTDSINNFQNVKDPEITSNGFGFEIDTIFIAKEPVLDPPISFEDLDVKVTYPGGEEALVTYINNHLKYPSESIIFGISGVVKVMFIVSKEGKITKSWVEGEKIGYGLEEEALRVINSIHKFNPGYYKGRPVSTICSLYITFEQEDE